MNFEENELEPIPYQHFEKIRPIDTGGFGSVFLYKYTPPNGSEENRAIKVLTTLYRNNEFYKRELQLLLLLKHQNIVIFYGVTEIEKSFNLAGLVLEYVDGGNLRDVIHHKTHYQYTLEDVLSWNLQSASALVYMHSLKPRRCIHRDIKPQNMLLDSTFQKLKLCDFGLSKEIDTSRNTGDVGTKRYMAPEVILSDRYNEKCDVYSWAVTFWECLTEETPFERKIDSNEGRKKRSLAPNLDPDYSLKTIENASEPFNVIIKKCTSHNPDDRSAMSSLEELLEDISSRWDSIELMNDSFQKIICLWDTTRVYYSKNNSYSKTLLGDSDSTENSSQKEYEAPDDSMKNNDDHNKNSESSEKNNDDELPNRSGNDENEPPDESFHQENEETLIKESMQEFVRRVSGGRNFYEFPDETIKIDEIGNTGFAHVIGIGGYAEVALATHTITGNKVAVKRFNLFNLFDDNERKITKERELLFPAIDINIEHPNIVQVYGNIIPQTQKHCNIVLEYMEGGDLRKIIEDREKGKFSASKRISWCYQAASALEYMHRKNIMHRNIDPTNMMLDRKHEVLKLTSFRFSKITESSDNTRYVGKNAYSAPETDFGKYEDSADIFSWAISAWEILSHKFLFKNLTKNEKNNKIATNNFLENLENASPKFNQMLKSCCHLDPKNRMPMNLIEKVFEILKKPHSNYDISEHGKFLESKISLWDNATKQYFFIPTELEHESKLEKYIENSLDETIPFKYFKTSCETKNENTSPWVFENLKERNESLRIAYLTGENNSGSNPRKVVLKFPSSFCESNFSRELSRLKSLKHKNIVKLIGKTCYENTMHAIVMEFIEGPSLHEIIHKDSEIAEIDRKYTLGDVLKWNFQAASALEYMHSLRCLHRDIKPDNMLIENSEKRTLKIVNLGGAKRIQNSLNFTTMGTEVYMAPEVFSGDDYNEECDVYSWTISFWECCTAERPQMTREYQSKINQICSAKFVDVIEKCSSSNPSDRKCMFVIAKWLENMLNNRKSFADTDSTFRDNHICVWNEQTNEFYHFSKTFDENTEYEKRFKNDIETNIFKIPMKRLKISRDIMRASSGKDMQIEINDKLKVLDLSKDGDEKNLKNEVLILSKLKHENIVKFYGYTYDDEFNYFGIVTDDFFLESFSLETAIAQGLYETKTIVEWGLQSARGLEYLHSQNILHCNIQPANMITRYSLSENKLKICNFKSSRDLQYSHPNEAFGTGIYMAPEVQQDGAFTTKSDVYSWTVMFWELCKREELFRKFLPSIEIEDYWQMESIGSLEEGKGRKLVNGSDKFNDFIQTCSNEDQEKRWSMADIVTLLENMMENSLKSPYLPDFDNIQADIVVKDNICLWSSETDPPPQYHNINNIIIPTEKLPQHVIDEMTEREFFYAPVNALE